MEKIRLLLIDDNQDMIIIGQRIFERAGYQFTSARMGAEGLEVAQSRQPDVILLDYLLPDMNGGQFIRALAASGTVDLERVPVIVLTAHPNTFDDLESCYALGLRACLNKPFGHRELVNVIDNFVRLARRELTPVANAGNKGRKDEWLEDLKLGVQAISSLCRDLTQSPQSNLSDQQRTDLSAIYNSSRRLVHLINR